MVYWCQLSNEPENSCTPRIPTSLKAFTVSLSGAVFICLPQFFQSHSQDTQPASSSTVISSGYIRSSCTTLLTSSSLYGPTTSSALPGPILSPTSSAALSGPVLGLDIPACTEGIDGVDTPGKWSLPPLFYSYYN